MKITLLIVLLALSRSVYSLPGGAPLAACDNLTPSFTPHTAPQTSALPYRIFLDPLCRDGYLSYNPGETYTLGIQSLDILDENPTQFRGFLVQSRLVADDGTNVGTFGEVAASMDVTRLSSCPRPEDGITHSERINAPGVYFSWTAPDNGTGSVVFRFAIVQTLNVHWADQTSMMIAEYGSNSTGDACMVAVTGVTTDGAAQLNGVGFWTLLVAALVVAVKVAL